MKCSSIRALPKEILDELHQRLLDDDFSYYADHVGWLKEAGFTISKSTLHRYVQEHQTSIMSAQAGESTLLAVEVRLRCLEVAAKLPEPESAQKLLKQADELLRWIYRGPY